ncbi:GntR family transcriptional regulator [Secundilactobacillus similis DSM 23365 = JCM 2765]|jgi:GntR family transcriptional regulator of arabinose operon|uniref:Arabinose operon repressor n=1 Tax=Secundilactobacillus similis DSM 23365 = JCM 2765 TaxID=1423804 RepID=A0A0R2FLZ6_9LACO|nr:GntR family transcriptional regulator [Secundilactobacillus similis]KRN25788.1 arabinose operon repressor [Secundilactobacillus similis DSM 23365 = JCM 2765]
MQAKYEKVEEALKNKILAGEYQIGEKLPTETELMNKYGVSRYTVRRSVGDLENEHLIYRIQGGGMYVNDWQSAKANSISNNRMIGVIATHIADYIFPSIISGADQIISDNGFAMLLANTHNDPQRERKSLITMLESNVAGLIIEPTQSTLQTPNADLYQKIQELKLPTVFINAKYEQIDGVSVTTDDEDAMKRMTDYLIDQGHQRILGVFQIDDVQGINRMNGFIKAYQRNADVMIQSNVIMYRTTDPIKKTLDQIEQALAVEPRPTAIMCYNDQLAIQVIDLVKSLDLQVPEDVSVTGFDDYSLGQFMEPAITTMVHEKEKMGHDAAGLLISMIDKQPVEDIVYEPELIIRNSVAKR